MDKLIKRTRLAGKILRLVPFLRYAGLNGSLARGESSDSSDIDILIFAKDGRLYTTRFFAVLLISLTGYRRHGKKIAGRLCLNCYLSTENLNIFPQNKKNALRVAKAYKYIIPLVDSGYQRKFLSKNIWMNGFSNQESYKKYSRSLSKLEFANFPYRSRGVFEKFLSGKFGDWLEDKLKKFQVKKINQGKKQKDEIYLSDSEIRLHPKK